RRRRRPAPRPSRRTGLRIATASIDSRPVHLVLASIGWPVLDRVHIGHTFAISPHGVGIALGFLFGSWWMLREGPKRGLDERNISTILFWALMGAIAGGRVLYVIAAWSQFAAPE